MPVQFAERTPLPAPPAQAFAVLVDPDFLAARAQRSGALEHTESVTTEGAVTVVSSTRTVPTTGLPQAASRFLGSTAVVEQVERWEPADADGSRRGSLRLTVRGAPVELLAAATLSAGEGGCVHELSGALTVQVPLFGGTVEKAALPGLLDLVRAEIGLARERLSAR
ncbi:DUF2505 family protein [Kineococcus sp. T13]|uniref:DUF2505 family protein n=1 Tax=Kineococcus vitellinus TaxID=2696565 RepID=UPI00141342FD|nr:DUF2505 family protein [Kineococcus vitellinus]